MTKLIQKMLASIGKPILYFLLFSAYLLMYLISLCRSAIRDLFVFVLRLIQFVKSIPTIVNKTPTFNDLKTMFVKLFALKVGKGTSTTKTKIHQTTKTPSSQVLVHKLSPPSYPRLKIFGFISLMFLSMVVVTVIVTYSLVLEDLPDPKSLTMIERQVSTKIYDRNGILLYTIFKEENRTPVSLSDIPDHTILATLAIEDAEFYNHYGFSLRGISRAFIRNYKEDTLYGGSTITQQLVKNTLLSPEKTVIRKLKELVLAIQIEAYFTKDEILEMYLNEVSYGGTAYGIQEASHMYFDKDVQEINLAESALLAGLPKSPTRYSPFGSNPEFAKGRQENVLNLMVVNGYITNDQKSEALEYPLKYAENKIDIKAPHFVMFVRDKLETTLGKELVEKGGLNVKTTLDYEIQKLAESVVSEELENLARLKVSNAAVIILDSKTNQLLAMVGSRDYFNISNKGNVNVTTSPRQPGSSIKVIAYSLALSENMTPASIIADTPVVYKSAGQPDYTPRNYDGTYRGNLTLRSALAESRNIPAVKVLNNYGVDKMIDLGKSMGITTWQDRSRFGLSLTLGGGEVTLLDLAQVYATLANYGQKIGLRYIESATDYKGNLVELEDCIGGDNHIIQANFSAKDGLRKLVTIEKDQCLPKQILDERVAFMITDILKDNRARTPAFGSNSSLVITNHPEVAVKTGTSNNLRDNLTIGYNQDYVVAVWVGNNDGSPMSRVASGVTGASPIFNKIMTALLVNKNSVDWRIPEGLVNLPICTYTGTLACEGCPVVNEWFKEGSAPSETCKPEWFRDENDQETRTGGRITNEAASTSN